MDYKDKIIGIASDHAGYKLKEFIIAFLELEGYNVVNFGTNSESSCDYPDFAHPLASDINSGKLERGITICGSGNGISMVVNKYPNVRAGLCWNPEISHLARAHNNANICSIPARYVTNEDALNILNEFFSTPFEGGRHSDRVKKIPILK